MVLTDLELAADLGHGAHPLAVGEGHIHIAAPLVEVADEGPDLAVVNGDGEVVGVQDDLPEARADLDVVTTGDSLERTSELDEGTAVVLVPTGILTPLELRIALGGDVRRPDAVVLGRQDIVLPVAVQADDIPAGHLHHRRLFAAADLAAHLRAGSLGHLGDTGVRIHVQVEAAVGADLDVRAVLGHLEFFAQGAEITAHVYGPCRILTELEFVSGREVHAQGNMPGTVGDHGDVAVPADAVQRQGADHGPVAGLGEIRERIVSRGNPSHTGRRVDEEVIDAVGADLDVRTVLADGELVVQAAEVTTEVHIPALILAELELIAGLEGDVSGHVVGTVGPHVQVAVPIDLIGRQGADDGPVAVLGVLGIRAADHFRNHDLEGAEGDTALGIDIAVTAVVLGNLLHGGNSKICI